jgi:DNA repair protein RecN (Recombination protein N)
MENAAAIDGSLSALLKRMEDLYYEAEDLAGEFRTYEENLTYDPQRLETVDERLAVLYKLKKKYVPSDTAAVGDEGGILAWKDEALAEIEALSGAGENRDKLKTEISGLEKDLFSRAASLSAKRAEGAKRLSGGITGILSYLGMSRASFSAAVLSKRAEKNEGGGEKPSLLCGPWGADDVEFMISANTGEPLKELARIASGGELSRVMLAIKTILSKTESEKDLSADTLVFDEVDTGIGGEVALSVGEYLAQIGRRKQIFCVTHLASIAVRADNHLKVEKKVIAGGNGERTVTGVTQLNREERRKEIARMLAGDAGAAALAHADELLAKYGRS